MKTQHIGVYILLLTLTLATSASATVMLDYILISDLQPDGSAIPLFGDHFDQPVLDTNLWQVTLGNPQMIPPTHLAFGHGDEITSIPLSPFLNFTGIPLLVSEFTLDDITTGGFYGAVLSDLNNPLRKFVLGITDVAGSGNHAFFSEFFSDGNPNNDLYFALPFQAVNAPQGQIRLALAMLPINDQFSYVKATAGYVPFGGGAVVGEQTIFEDYLPTLTIDYLVTEHDAPEPATLAFLGLGMTVLLSRRRRVRK